MNWVIEIWRGLRLLTYWFSFAPFVCRRMIYAPDGTDLRKIFTDHFRGAIHRSGIELVESGTPPPKGKGSVAVYNESSLIDVISIVATLWPHMERTSGADMWTFIPYLRRAFARAEIDLVPRGNRAGTDRLMDKMVKAVKRGDRLAWGGEGRLSGFDGVARFKRGASLIAIRAQAPIYPVVYYGGYQIMPTGGVRLRPGTVYIHYGDAIPTKGLSEDDARELADKVQAVSAGIYEELKSAYTT